MTRLELGFWFCALFTMHAFVVAIVVRLGLDIRRAYDQMDRTLDLADRWRQIYDDIEAKRSAQLTQRDEQNDGQ